MRGQKAQDTGQEGAGPDVRLGGWWQVGVVGAPDRVARVPASLLVI